MMAMAEKVEQMLAEIEPLVQQRDNALLIHEAVMTPPQKATLLQIKCEIQRKLLLVEWYIFLLGQQPNGDGDAVATEARQLLQNLKDQVISKRQAWKATKHDLREMLVPPLPPKTELDNNASIFPNYLDLPERLVRDKILSYLTNPFDKLNVKEAIPSEANLMKWTDKDLKFQAVISVILTKTTIFRPFRHSWITLYNIGLVNSDLSNLIADHYSTVLKKDYLQSLCNLSNYYYSASFGYWRTPNFEEFSQFTTAAKQVCKKLPPITTTVRFDISEDLGIPQDVKILLETCGHQIWSCSMSLLVWFAPVQTLRAVAHYLHFMPNLQSLRIVQSCLYEFDNLPPLELQKLEIEIESVVLPELPALRYLVILGGVNPCAHASFFGPLKAKLVEKYQGQLMALHVGAGSPRNLSGFNKYNTPKLEAMNVLLLYRAGLDEILEFFLPQFSGCPLMSILVEPSARNCDEVTQLMIFLGESFGGTLERLTIDLSHLREGAGDVEGEGAGLKPEIVNVKLPKLKYFAYGVHPGGWGMLLLFPSLEEFVINQDLHRIENCDLYEQGNHFDGLEQENGQDDFVESFDVNEDRLQVSTIWKLMPNLKLVKSVKTGMYRRYGS